MQPWSRSLRTLLLCLLLPWPGAGQFQVTGPSSPVIAVVGAEAVFPCHLSPSMDAQHMEVRWFHTSHSGLVHYSRDSRDHLEDQQPEYRGRTRLLQEQINQGQVALRIHPVRPADGGDYSCSFASPTHRNDAQFHVEVTASGLAPRIHVEPGPSGSIKLTCTSPGWYPEPEVQWSGPGGLHLEPASETRTVDGDGLFRVESSLTIMESPRGHVSCSIRNPVLNEEKEARVSVAGGLFPKVSPWTMGLGVLFSLFAFCLVVTGILLLVTRRANENLLSMQDREAINRVNEKIKEKLERTKFLAVRDLIKARHFAEDIKLDEDTAHPSLSVSSDGKHVYSLSVNQDVPDNPGRFTLMPFVLGKNSFSSGSHYWEVNIGGKSRWDIGLCLDSVDRGRAYEESCPEDGFWTLSLKDGQYKVLSMHSYNVNVPIAPEVVGIFLQYEKGLISFYDVIELTILFTLKSKFTQPLRPYFYPGPPTRGSTLGLTICPVS